MFYLCDPRHKQREKGAILMRLFLSAALARSGPLDFSSEKKMYFFSREKGLGHVSNII